MGELVTIAIASYNNAAYIDRCINSVINQTYSNLDILIVDDGSTDDTVFLLGKYQSDERIRVIVKENGGLSSVRQRALDEAKGNYICFIDADDYLKENYIERMLNKITEDHSDVCVCSTLFEDEKGTRLSKETEIFKCSDSEVVFEPKIINLNNIDDEAIGELHVSDSWNKMYDISFLRRNQMCFNIPKGLNGTDFLFNRKLILYSPKYSTVSEYCYVHVIYKSSAVHRKGKNLIQMYIFITEELMKVAENIGINNELSKFFSLFYHRGLYASFLDVYNETSELNTVKDEFSKMLFLHKRFVSNNYFIKDNLFSEKHLHILIFNLFLYNNLNGIIPYYFRIRNFLIKYI